MGVSVIFVSRNVCVLQVFVTRDGVFGAVDGRENGTTDQGTRATMNDARAESTTSMDPVTRARASAVAFSGSKWLDSGFLKKRNVARSGS